MASMKTKINEATFLLRQKKISTFDTKKHSFHPITHIVRGALWVVLASLVLGGFALAAPQNGRVAGISLLNQSAKPQVQLAATSGVVVADASVAAQPTPTFTIVSKNPQGSCTEDSFYTTSSQVSISLQNVSNLKQYQVVTNPADFLSAAWLSIPSSNCNGSALVPYDLTNIPSFQSIIQNRNQLLLYVRFLDNSGNVVPSATPHYITDSIYFGYPWVQVQRGDTHSNAGINGEFSDIAGQVAYSELLCNPPAPGSNADYMVTMSNNGAIQQVSGVPTSPINCDTAQQSPSDGKSETFGTKGVTQEGNAMVVHLSDNVPIQNQVPFDTLIANATAECNSNVQSLDLGQQNQQTHLYDPSLDGCSSILDANGAPRDTSHGQIIHLIDSGTNPLNITASQPLANAPQGLSGSITLVSKYRTIKIQSDIVYDSAGINSPINNLDQLARLAVLTYGRDSNGNASDIIIGDTVQNLVGIFFSERSTIYTSQNPKAVKLSIYGSLIANDIQFNRNWLGKPQ